MKALRKTTTLYDAGGLILVLIIFGLPVGIIVDYLWNLLVLTLALPRVTRSVSNFPPGEIAMQSQQVTKGKRAKYCIFITLIGIVVDWAYFELTWDMSMTAKTAVWAPAMGQGFQFALLLLPMVMLGLVNFALSYSYLKLERRQAIIMGAVMGFFTAPWLLPIIPYTLGWVSL